jgi:hypothetical protein
MPVELLDPDGKDPVETHAYGEGATFVVEGVPGTVFDRGYTRPSGRLTYAVHCEDNVERTFTEGEVGGDRVKEADA